MYKRSEPIKWLHSVQNHMANVYSSEVCLQTKNFPKISKFFFFKNTPKYDKLSKISNISIKTILELRTKFGNFGNFGHISDRLRTIHNTCSNLIGSEPLYIPCIVVGCTGNMAVSEVLSFTSWMLTSPLLLSFSIRYFIAFLTLSVLHEITFVL